MTAAKTRQIAQTPKSTKGTKLEKSRLYTSRINHVGALLPDTKVMLVHWDLAADVPANLERMRAENIFAKASRSRIPEMLQTFRERYLTDPEILRALVVLSQEDASDSVMNPILYLLATQAEPLLHDVVLDLLAPMLARGQTQVRTDDVSRWLRQQVASGRDLKPAIATSGCEIISLVTYKSRGQCGLAQLAGV